MKHNIGRRITSLGGKVKKIAPTPGPWRLSSTNNGEKRISGGNWAEFASVIVEMEGGLPSNEGEANARLIAAAPEMYTALKEADEIIQKATGSRSSAIEMALKKAEGADE